MELTYRIILEPGDEGGYVVTVPALPGCFTQGATLGQALERAREAIEVHVAGLINGRGIVASWSSTRPASPSQFPQLSRCHQEDPVRNLGEHVELGRK